MIVFPMAGLSSRFAAAGYTLPKYRLEAHGRTLFAHAVGGFSAYFDTEPFLFIVRNIEDADAFVRNEAHGLGIRNFDIVMLDHETAGQAETVEYGLRIGGAPAECELTVFNIDTFRPGFRFPGFGSDKVDGFLEVFRGSGDNWSYVRPSSAGSDKVAETAEKRPISDLCCTGLYNFSSVKSYRGIFERFKTDSVARMGLKELYIAPMYNLLIGDGADIRYSLIDRSEVIFCGVPQEYDDFLSSDLRTPC